MAVFILKMLFFALSSISNMVSFLILNGAARLLVLVIKGLRIPGEAAHNGLELVSNLIKKIIEYFLEFLSEMISSLISTGFDLVKEAVLGSMGLTGGAIGGLITKMKEAFDGFSSHLSTDVFQEFLDMIWTMVNNFWEHSRDAMGYVKENA